MKPVKLYLSSYRIGADRNALAEVVETSGRAGIVSNALDGFADRLRIFAREWDDLSTLGFECEELDPNRGCRRGRRVAPNAAG